MPTNKHKKSASKQRRGQDNVDIINEINLN
jgi:hypothetical protein